MLHDCKYVRGDQASYMRIIILFQLSIGNGASKRGAWIGLDDGIGLSGWSRHRFELLA